MKNGNDLKSTVDGEASYCSVMLAGGVGGLAGDMLLHSLDTVKTRQQGIMKSASLKDEGLRSCYLRIFRDEGIRGLYAGVVPALVGSLMGSIIFFGVYEFCKRRALSEGVNASAAYLVSGFVADLAIAPIYVPSEVLKTRLQLQGAKRAEFHDGYRSTGDAIRSIYRREGMSALFSGYRATLLRDLPFSALQFCFYEWNRAWAVSAVGSNRIGWGLEIITAASAGGMAGFLTCPLDVIKTQIQTQPRKTQELAANVAPGNDNLGQFGKSPSTVTPTRLVSTLTRVAKVIMVKPTVYRTLNISHDATTQLSVKVGPAVPPAGSVISGLTKLYSVEGVAGLFRGCAPRVIWTSVQSCVMFFTYQTLLPVFENWTLCKNQHEGSMHKREDN